MLRLNLLLTFTALGFLVGCGPDSTPDTEESGGGTFRFNVLETPNSLDPAWIRDTASSDVGSSIHEGLVEFDPVTLEVRPCIAESWDISEDGLTYTFRVRRGVRFHDNGCFPGGVGREVTARDFKYSFERVCDPRVASPGSWMFLGFVEGAQEYRDAIAARREVERRRSSGAMEESSDDRFRKATINDLIEMSIAGNGVSGLSCPDDWTFVVRLERPFSPFLYRMGHSFSWVVPREAVEHYGDDFFNHPVGAGPFQFVKWTSGQRIVLQKNPHYWGKDKDGKPLPHLDGIEITRIADTNSEHYELLQGNLHFQFPIPLDQWDNIFNEDLSLKPDYQRFQIQSGANMRIEYIGMLNTDPLFQNKTLRQALNYAINREEIAATILNHRAVPDHGAVVPKGMPGYETFEGPYHYDPDRARQLLAEAGYPNAEGLPLLELQLNSSGRDNEKIAEIIQGYMEEIGVKVSLQVVDWRVHLDTVREGKVPFYRMGWLNDYPSPENSLMLLEGHNHPPDGENYACYKNPEFDRFFAAALESTDPAEQNRLYRKAEEVAVADAPWIFLYFLKRYRLVAPEVRDFPMNAIDRRYLKWVWLDNAK